MLDYRRLAVQNAKGTCHAKTTGFIAASILLAPISFAEPAPAPTPTKDEIPALIKQLGDDKPQGSHQASQQLRKLGGDALPALEQARKSDDPEVATRAQTITRKSTKTFTPSQRSVRLRRFLLATGSKF